MKNLRLNKMSILLTIIAMLSISVSPALPISQPVRAGAAPPPKSVVLGGKATLHPTDFAPAQIRASLNSPPFTVAEMKGAARARIRSDGRRDFILDKRNRLVPLEGFVAELNQYEGFLNKLGYTLRDGPLAASKFKGSPEKNPLKRNLGVILRLKQKHAEYNQVAGKKVIFDPTIYERDASRAASLIEMPGNPERTRNAGVRTREIPLRQNPAGHGTRVMRLLDDHIDLCPCASGCNSGNDLSGDVALNSVCANPPCANQGGVQNQTTVSTGVICGQRNSNPNANQSTCFSDCLYSGKLGAQWKGISFCTKVTSGSDWFDAGFCLELNSSNCNSFGKLRLQDAASMHMDVKLFGLSFNLLDAEANTRYVGGQTNPQGEAKVTIPLLDNIPLPSNFDQDFVGPEATVLVGPIPITIKTGLTARLGFLQPYYFLTPPPQQCGFTGAGKMGMSIGAKGYADLHASASVDAIVADAGIEAKLILVNDSFGVGITTDINPAKNNLTVAPGFVYRLQHLAGIVLLYAEIDLGVYSKRFEVELFNFPGITTGDQYSPITEQSFGAIKD